MSVGYTLIARLTDFEVPVSLATGTIEQGPDGQPRWVRRYPRYRSTTLTNALRMHTLLARRFGIEAFVSLEQHVARWGDLHEHRQARFYPKLGLSATFWF